MATSTPEAETSAKPTVSEKRLLNHIVDIIAQEIPQRIYAKFPISATGYDDGYEKITYADPANAVNGVAWWLHKELGPAPAGEFPSLAYIGVNGVRYNAVTLGAVKVGYKPQGVTAILAALETAVPRVLEIPSKEELLAKHHPYFPYEKTFSSAKKDPFVVVHTSGTTELSKPIIWTHDFVASCEDNFSVVALPVCFWGD